jgi:hypothetical protein
MYSYLRTSLRSKLRSLQKYSYDFLIRRVFGGAWIQSKTEPELPLDSPLINKSLHVLRPRSISTVLEVLRAVRIGFGVFYLVKTS